MARAQNILALHYRKSKETTKGYILTNEHVISRASTIKVTLSNNREFDAHLVGADSRSDLTIITYFGFFVKKLRNLKLNKRLKIKNKKYKSKSKNPLPSNKASIDFLYTFLISGTHEVGRVILIFYL